MTIATTESSITDHEAAQIDRANATKATPVVSVHGLWLLPSSWDRWVTLFEEAGYVAVEKRFVLRKPQTIYRITAEGRTALTEYVEALKTLLGAAITV